MDDAKKLIKAKYYNSERTQIMVDYLNENDDPINVVVPADPDNSLFKKLMTFTTLDDIHENTWSYIKEQQIGLENAIMNIAKRNGQIYDVGSANPKLYKEVARIISTPFDPEADKELLFVMKLEIFDLEEVKKCKDRTLKSALRKSESPLDAILATCNIIKSVQA